MKNAQSIIYKSIFFFLLLLPGSAVWGQTTVTIDINSTGITSTSYDGGAERTWSQGGIDFGGKAILKAIAPNSGTIQFQSNNGVLYNTMAIPGIIKTIKITQNNGNSFTLYGGSTSRLVNNIPGNYTVGGTAEGTSNGTIWTSNDLEAKGYTFFAIKKNSGASYVSSIEITYVPVLCFEEDFSSITTGNNTDPNGSDFAWTGNANFPTVIKAYQAGGAVRLGNTVNPRTGSIESRELNEVEGDITVNIMVKGWTNIEGGLKVSIDGQSQSLTYSAKMDNSFELVTVSFIGVAAGSKLKIETDGPTNQNQRCFIDEVKIICGEESGNTENYYQSVQSGNWTSVSTWQASEDGINWNPATSMPGADAISVKIRLGHTVTLNSAGIKLSKTEVEENGTLIVNNSDFELSGTGYALTVKSGGIFTINGGGKAATNSTGKALIDTGGIFKVVSFSGSNLLPYYLHAGNANNKFKFANNSVLSWETNNTMGSSGYSEIFDMVNPGDLVIFKMIQTFSPTNYGSGTTNRFHAVLELPDDRSLNLQGNGDKIFEGGITGNGTLNVTYSSDSGNLVFGNTTGTATLGSAGNLKLIVPHNKLQLQNIEVPSGAGVTIESNGAGNPNTLTRTAGDISIKGVLDITDMRIVNTANGGIFVRNGGTLRTKFTGGLFGNGSAIVNDSNFTMDTGSTIDYYATDDQTISSGKEYYHLIFSGAGIKTPQNATEVNTNGSVTITGTPTVNYTNFNLASTGINNTDFTMDGGKLIIGTGGTQPRPGGTYSITGGTIEFTGNSITNIRVIPEYYDIVISGQKKKPGGIGFKINNVLSVTATGELTIPSTPDNVSSHVVTAHKGVQVANGGKLTFENNAQLMQDNSGVNNSGDIIVERLFNFSAERKQYNFVSSPVNNQNIKEIFGIGYTIPYALVYNEVTDFFVVPNSYTEKRGYAIKEVSGSGVTQMTAGFKGEITNGILTMNLSKSGHGFNLVGNPYPSNLNLNQLYTDNSSKITPTFYFWDNRANDLFEQMGTGYNGYYQDVYAKYNAASGTGSPATHTGGNPKIPNQYAKIGTGFIVQATNSALLNFDNSQRNTNIGPGFFGRGQQNEEKDRYWLTLTSPVGISVTSAVVYFNDGKNDFGIDDTESFGPSDDIYSIVNDHQLAIQGREPFRIKDEVPLGYKAFEEGIYVISLYKKEGVFESNQAIYLVDKMLNHTVNLCETPYKFRTLTGEFNNRFIIIYNSQPNGDIILQTKNQISIAKNGNQIEISSNLDKIDKIEIFDLNSRPVFKKSKINQNNFTVDTHSFNHQIFVVKVRTKTGEELSKKIVF